MRQPANKDHNPAHIVVLDIETIVPNPPSDANGGFPKWPLHQPVVASLMTATRHQHGRYRFCMTSVRYDADNPTRFYDHVEELLPEHGLLITMNGRGFDIPVLAIGAAAAGCWNATTLSKLHRANRFSDLHADLADLYCQFGAAPRASLSEICDRFGIPVKTDVHGSEVGDLYARGEIQRIVDYCESDVAATAVAAWAWFAWRDSNDALLAEPLAEFARWIEADPANRHLRSIARCDLARWAKRRAMVLSVDHAWDRTHRKITEEKDERAFSAVTGEGPFEDDDVIF